MDERPLEGEDEENVKFLQELVKLDILDSDPDDLGIKPQQIRDLYIDNKKNIEACFDYIIKFNEEMEGARNEDFHKEILRLSE